MPAGRGQRCESCYWKDLLNKRIELASAAFPLAAHAKRFHQFGAWLAQQVGVKKAAITLNRYMPFFLKLSALATQSPTELLACCSAQELRKNRFPMRFLESANYITISPQAKQEAAERQRIKALLVAPQDDQTKEILERYHVSLVARLKQGKIGLRSIRLALRPAVNFLKKTKRPPLPTQSDLNAYLRTSPGQRAALSGFVCFLRDEYQAELELPKGGSKVEQEIERRKDVEKELIALLNTRNDSAQYRQQLLNAALRYFHRIPPHLAAEIAISATLTITSMKGWMLLYNKRRYWLPTAIALLASKNQTT